MNRNPIKQWELTFPQIGSITTKQQFHEELPPSEYSICALEQHSDGGEHLHLGIKLKKGISHSKLIKYLTSKYPEDWKRIHISPIKNWDNWNDYCKKEDPEVVVTGTLEKKKKISEFERDILAGDLKREEEKRMSDERYILACEQRFERRIERYKKELEKEGEQVDDWILSQQAKQDIINEQVKLYRIKLSSM